MKREIKFRGKDLIHNEWIFGGIAIDKHNSVVILPKEDWSKGGCVDESTIGQFTGIKDKNGIPIYEGDIIRSFRSYKKYVVKWSNYGARMECICIVNDAHLPFECVEEIEIIGNIYDNPELLEYS